MNGRAAYLVVGLRIFLPESAKLKISENSRCWETVWFDILLPFARVEGAELTKSSVALSCLKQQQSFA